MWLFRGMAALSKKLAGTVRANPEMDRLDQVLPMLGAPIAEVDHEMRCVVMAPKQSYRVRLYAWVVAAGKLHLMASIDYREDRDLILRELAIDLLDENHGMEDEAFVLIPKQDNDRLIGCRRVLSLHGLDNRQLLAACRSVISHMDRMVARLYLKGLIPSGPFAIGGPA